MKLTLNILNGHKRGKKVGVLVINYTMRESNHFRGRKGDPWEKRNCMRRKVVELEPIDAI